MKKLLIFFTIMLTSSLLYSAGFVEEFRSKPGRRPPLSRLMGDASAEPNGNIQDLNGNGSPDLPMMNRDEEDAYLAVYDGKTRESILKISLENRDISRFVGFFKFYDKPNRVYEATHLLAVTAGTNPMDVILMDLESGQVDLKLQNIKPIVMADLDGDSRLELVYGDVNARQVVMIGWEENTAKAASEHKPEEWNIAAGPGDYSLRLKYESDPNMILAYDASFVDKMSRWDVNGDGPSDIVMLMENDDSQVTGMLIRSGQNQDIAWEFKFPKEHLPELQKDFHGFYDVNADGTKEALFGRRTLVSMQKSVHTVNKKFEILAVHDLDNDGYDDLVGRGLEKNTVQVWGSGVGTHVSNEQLRSAGFYLHDNYPNPFNPKTTIHYSLSRPAHVTLTIYDARGRQVRRFDQRFQSVGEYTVSWNGRDDRGRIVPSGTYFYQLDTGDFNQSRHMILLK